MRTKGASQKTLMKRSSASGSNAEFPKATIENPMDMTQVFKAVRDEDGEIIDFIWILNDHTSEKIHGDVIGKSVLKHNPGVIEEGIFNILKTVVETGIPDKSQRHYVDKEFDGWVMQLTVKLNDGVAITTTDITDLKKEARRKSDELKAFLLKLSDVLLSLQGSMAIRKEACRVLAEHLHADRVLFCLLEDQGEIVNVDGYHAPNVIDFPGRVKVKDLPGGLFDAITNGEVIVRDVQNDIRIDETDRQKNLAAQVGAYICLPLIKGGETTAVIAVHQATARAWRESEVMLTREMAELTWTAIEKARAEKAIHVSDERMRAMKDTYQSVVNGAKVEDSLKRLAQLVTDETHGEARAVFHIAGEEDAGNIIDKNSEGCLSFPIITRDDKVVGTFAMCFDTHREPTERHLALADIVTGTASVVISNHSDNVNRARAERLLKDVNAQLRQIDEAKTDFFNNVSHEFRTPLTLLIGPLEEVIKKNTSKIPPDDIQKLNVAYRGAIRLQKLVNTLLDFARIEAGKLEAFYQPTDFSKITADVAANFRSVIEKAGLKYVVKSEPINEAIYLNREMWEKIVSNLLSNAFKFTHKGKIEVILRNKKKNVELRIKDTGIGIAQRNINRIFERFTRVEAKEARTFEGTGIGLALVRELVLANGGSIKVKSTENAGSEFIVSIPKGKDHLPRQQIYETRENLNGNILSEPFIEEVSGWRPEDEKLMKRKLKKYLRDGALRVLVAEDNADMRDYLTSILSEDKYEILAVEDGQKVLTFLRQGGQADIILADVMMPNVDGYDLVQWLKSDPRFSQIPIVLISARASEEAKIEGLKMGADDYLVKPFSTNELRAVVMSRIKQGQKNRSNGMN
jgi:signal transduction histidine kinase/ActR/RegA family two-component response regulator